MFELSHSDVFKLADFFAASEVALLHVKVGDVEVLLSRDAAVGLVGVDAPAAHGAAAPAAPAAPAPAPAVASPAPAAADVHPPAAAPGAPEGGSEPAASSEPAAGDLTIPASSVGVFYRKPQPDQPPYVDVGSVVDADTTVGLIEAMKVFTAVPAGVSGTITEVLADNASFVEFGQPLFRVRDDAAGGEAA